MRKKKSPKPGRKMTPSVHKWSTYTPQRAYKPNKLHFFSFPFFFVRQNSHATQRRRDSASGTVSLDFGEYKRSGWVPKLSEILVEHLADGFSPGDNKWHYYAPKLRVSLVNFWAFSFFAGRKKNDSSEFTFIRVVMFANILTRTHWWNDGDWFIASINSDPFRLPSIFTIRKSFPIEDCLKFHELFNPSKVEIK